MIKNIFKFIPSVIIPMIINTLFLLLNTKFLNVGEYGIYNIYISSINLIYSFLLSFLQTASFRFYSIKSEIKNKNTYLSTYVISNIIGSVIILPVVMVLNKFIVELNPTLIWFSVLTTGLYNFYLNLNRLEGNYKSYTSLKVLADLFKLVLFIISIVSITHISHIHPIISMYAAYFIFILIEISKSFKNISFKHYSINLVISSFKYAFPLIGVSVMNLLLTASDQYLILFFLDDTEVGLYSFGYRISDTILVNMAMVVLLVGYPKLMSVYDNQTKSEAGKVLEKMNSFNLWFSIPIAFWLILNFNRIINLLFPNYQDATLIAQNVVIVSFLHNFSMFSSKGIELSKNTKQLFYDLTVTVIVNIIYNIIFLPIYGILAAVHGSILSYIVYNILLIKHSGEYIDIRIDYKFILKITLLSGIVILIPELFLTTNNLNILKWVGLSILTGLSYIYISYKSGLIKKIN